MAINPDLAQNDGGGGPITTLAQVKAALAATKARLAQLQASQPGGGVSGVTDSQNAARLAAEAKAAADAKAAKAPSAEDAYYTVKVGTTGKTQYQIDTLQNAIDTAALINQQYGAGNVISQVDPLTGKVKTDTSKVKVSTPEEIAAQEAAAAAKAAADKAAALKAAADKAIAAAEKAAADARTAKELEDARAALAAANKAAADAAAAAKAALDEANAAAAAAAKKAKEDLEAAEKAGNAAKIQAAKDAAAAANAAAAAAATAAAQAAAQAAAASANTNINVTGNTVIPFAGSTAADIAAKLAADKALEQKMADRIATSQMLSDRFQKYNLSSLAPKIKELAINGANEATIMLELQETEEYKQRFKANEGRIKKGLAVLDPGTYLRVEDGYRQVLREYGLKQFDTDDYVSKFIANDMSPTEFSNRVVTAVQRVQNADPALIKQLDVFYGIKPQGLLAYVLDPEQELPKIERQIAAGEIGLAASRQGLTAGVSVAEQLAAQGISEAEARKGYATIADILPTSEKLSDIYGTTLDGYRQAEGEQEVFNSLASAQRKRQKLTAREVAAFGGASGTSRTSLTTSSVGQY